MFVLDSTTVIISNYDRQLRTVSRASSIPRRFDEYATSLRYRQDIKITFHRSFSGLRAEERDKQRRLNEIREIGFETRRYPLYGGCNTRRVLQRHIRRYVS